MLYRFGIPLQSHKADNRAHKAATCNQFRIEFFFLHKYIKTRLDEIYRESLQNKSIKQSAHNRIHAFKSPLRTFYTGHIRECEKKSLQRHNTISVLMLCLECCGQTGLAQWRQSSAEVKTIYRCTQERHVMLD